MKIFASTLAALFMTLSFPVVAQNSPVVVELFTSQGCSSCPPADKLMHKLAARDDVIALALHVDYWDYIGWKDIYADPEYAHRQRRYAKEAHRSVVYTPQMVVNGQEDVIGTHAMELTDLIAEHKAKPQTVMVRATRNGGKVVVQVSNIDGSRAKGPFVVQMVQYTPLHEVDVTRGENAGKRLKYSNVVDAWTVMGRWNGKAPVRLTGRLDSDRPAVILVQRKGPGAIVAATRVN